MGIDTTALESGPHEMALCFQNESMQKQIQWENISLRNSLLTGFEFQSFFS